jgi:hypothetical protein
MTKQEFIGFADEVIAKEVAKKAIAAEIKEATEIFAQNHGKDKQSIKKALKDYKDFLKDQAQFEIVDRELAEIIEEVCYESVPVAVSTSTVSE